MKKIVLIGHGKMAIEYTNVIKCYKNFEIIAVVGRNEKNVKKFAKTYQIPNYFTKIESLNSIKNFDLFLICVPIIKSKEIIVKLTNFKKIIFFEKPMGLNFNEAKYIFQKLYTSKINAYMLLNRRNYFVTKYALKKIQSSKSKRIIKIIDQQNTKSKKLDTKVNQFIHYTNSIHLIDYILLFARGKIIKKYSNFSKQADSNLTNCILLFSSGDIVSYECFYDVKLNWQINISTKEYNYEFKPLETLKINNKDVTKLADVHDYDKIFKPGLYNSIKEIDLKLKNKKISLPDLSESFNLMKLIKYIHE